MPKIDFEVISEKHGEGHADVPAEILDQGNEAVKRWLIDNGDIENALDYATMTSLKVIYTKQD